MKCLLCENWSFSHICNTCQKNYLQPSIYKRKVEGIEVISFYRYSEIEKLLFTKHTPLGYYIFTILARNSFKLFSENFTFDEGVASLSIDDHNKNGYSHTAILNKALKSKVITPYYGKMRAKNSVHYSATTLDYRKKNPRNFEYKRVKENSLILVDDIVTTGLTIKQAVDSIDNADTLFVLTLASVEMKN